MVVRRSTNSHAAALKRLPHRAMFRRQDPLSSADRDRLDAAIRGIAAGAEYLTLAGSRGDELDCTVIRFDCPEKARAMQAWLDASGIATWPAPEPRRDIPQLKVGG